jgi:hypothetical protein
VGVLAGQAAGSEPPRRAARGAGELRAKLLEAQGKLKAIYVVYRSEEYRQPDAVPGTYMRRALAARGPAFLFNDLTHPNQVLTVEDDPLRAQNFATPDVCHTWHPFQREYARAELKPGDRLPGTLDQLFFFITTGVWVLDQRPPPVTFGDCPCALRVVARSPLYKLRPEQEKVAGHWCHVLEHPGRDRLWLDAARGCCLVAREFCSPKNGAVALRYELSGHREVEPGVWLPQQIRGISYNTDGSSPEERQRVLNDSNVTILEVKVNDQVDEGLFRFQPPPGALLTRPGAPPKQIEPGGGEMLDDLARWARRHVPLGPPPARQWPAYLALGLPVVLVGCWEALLWKRKRAARAPQKAVVSA